MAKLISRADSALISDNLKTTSLIIAEHFGKEHSKVIRTIEAMDLPEEYHKANFGVMVHEVKIGSGAVRQDKAYALTRDGFALLVMGFTGKRAMGWKIKFLEAFNQMEAALHGQPDDMPKAQQLGFVAGLKNKLAKMTPEELADWAHGRAGKVDQVITYIETTLLDPSLSAEARAELARLRAITKHLRGDAPEIKQTKVRAHMRQILTTTQKGTHS